MATNDQTHSTLGDRPVPKPAQWISSLATLSTGKVQNSETRMRTMISCDVREGKRAIYVPPDMAELQPRTLRYMHTLARVHNLQLVEDRRRVAIQSVKDKRNGTAPVFAKALSELLKQLGMPGAERPQSRPHRLNADSPHIDIDRLIRMVAHSAPKAKRVKVQPNRTLIDVLGNHREAINVYACKLLSAHNSTILSHFDSSHFRAIGYSTGKQYVMHVCVAGGSISKPCIWADFHTLTRSDFRFQLLSTNDPNQDVGLMYATFYLDVAEAPTPWWLNREANTQLPANEENIRTLLKKAS